eukprot:TRINITY_DN87_c0_g1_i2.p1 TRINITY_DN87_c0_g1~~TRINITY_DN87_c0_g1_i2.p1  ORF type:complete len:494 (-),score=214.73 TRINITY_DN87_c0_g1_i2:78-1523(-)
MSSDTSATEAAFMQKLSALADTTSNKEEVEKFRADTPGIGKFYSSFLRNRKRVIDWSKIHRPPQDMVVPYADLGACPEDLKKKLSEKLVVLKLNGGLGTTMGCTGPKSVIEVRNDLTFLDLTVQQIQHMNSSNGANVPLVLMNSFNTHRDTGKIIQKYKHANVRIETFNQSRFPRILKDTLMPVPETLLGNDADWYPPGHGDVFYALLASGYLKKFLDEGREYVFVSNVDNLGATVDFNILRFMEEKGVEYIMEVTDKTRADVKGGTLIEYEGKAKLLEIAQVPSAHVEEFKSIKKFKIFNTNNLWINLKAMQRILQQNLLDDIDIIVNPKVQDGKAIIQLEIAAGAAIQYFNNAKGVNVPRSRFLPVKSTSDLFIIQSNMYSLVNGALVVNPARVFPSVPLVKLGDTFKKVSDYMARLKGIPDVLELDQLTVSGDVTFGPNMQLKGTVIIVANHGSRIDVPEGAVLENKVVSGNLRILEH